MSLNDLTILAAESGESGELSPYLIGGGVLGILLALLLVLLAFAGGREHS